MYTMLTSLFDPATIDIVSTFMTWVGIPSLFGFVSLYVLWISLPPEISIDSVADKSKNFNSESCIKIKNLGKLPALNITATVTNLNVKLNGITMRDCQISNAPGSIPRLANGEYSEISITPGVKTTSGAKYTEFSYTLQLSYSAKLFLVSRSFNKLWKVELRNLGNEFTWNVSIATN